MKQFNFSGTRKHKHLQQLLAMCLTLVFLLSFQGASVIAAGSGALTSLSVSGVSNFTFDPAVTDYTLYIPQTYTNGAADTLVVPTVYAEGAEVNIDYPASVADDEVITISVGDGASTVYTLTFDVIGENLYTNGDFEDDGIPMSTGSKIVLSKETEENGNHYVVNTFAATASYMTPTPTIKAGKTYLFSRMIKRTAETVIADNGTNRSQRIQFLTEAPAGSVTSLTYPDVWTEAQYGIKPTETWQPMTGLIKPASDYTDKSGFIQGSWSNATTNVLAMDNCFIGELVVAKLEITESNGAAVKTLTKPEVGTDTVALGAKFQNQLGTTVGMDGLSVNRWELAESYAGVNIDNEGNLTFDATAPSEIKVLAYADASAVSTQQGTVKGEVVIDFVGVEDLEPAELSDIEIEGFSIPGFTSQKSSYTMYIPYSYNALRQSIPDDLTVNATPVHEGTTYTTTRNGNILTVTATALDGTEKNYNIAIQSVGDNLYINGGFELDGHSYKTQNNYGTAEKLTDNPGGGTYYLEVGFKSELLTFEPKATLQGGKIYLSSRMIRKSAKTSDDITMQSEDINYALHDFVGKANVYFDGMELDNYSNAFQLVPGNSWKRYYALLQPTNDYADPQFYRTHGWTTWNYMAIDECFLGELTVADISYLGETQIAIPESGEQSYGLSADLQNQLGTTLGLENETVTWELGSNSGGVSVAGNNLIVTDEAREETIRVRAIVEPSFGDGYKIAKCFDIVLNSESTSAEVPRAIQVQVSGVVDYNQTLTGSYTYLNTKNIDEDQTASGTSFTWLYADTENGTKYIIPGATTQTLTLASDSPYVNKYLFFQVTPVSVEGKVGVPAISNCMMRPMAPTAVNLKVTGGGYVGSEVTGNYTFYDKNGDAESGSTYRWLRSANMQGPYTAIAGATDIKYTLTNDDVDQYISFEVTPKTSVVPTGEGNQPITSTGVVLAARPTVSDVVIHKVTDSSYRVSYNYAHPLDIPQGVCRVQWYIDGVAAGTEMSQTVGTGARKLSVVVTPVAAQPPYEGVAVTTQLAIASGGQLVGRVPSGGGGGGVSLGGGSKVVPVPEKTPEPVVNEPVKHWATDGIDFVMSRGIMQEPVPGDFCNARLVTRRDFIYYVMKTLGYQESAYNHEFQDVSGDDYYAGMLQTAVNEGIISKDEKFNPERNVSREEICKIIVLASELQGNAGNNLDRFADGANISEWARGYVGAAVETGLLKGVSETEFLPFGQVTREQTAVILKRLFDYKNGGVLS